MAKWLAIAAVYAVVFCIGVEPVFASPKAVGNGTVDGRDVQILEDGSWRYIDPKTPVCIDSLDLAVVCVAPQDWHRVPDPSASPRRLVLGNDIGIEAFVTIWATPKDESKMTAQEKAQALIHSQLPRLDPDNYLLGRKAGMTKQDGGLKPNPAGHGATSIAGVSGKYLVLTSATGVLGTHAYSIAVSDSVSIVVETFENSTLNTGTHQRVLAALLSGIKIKGSL